MKKTVLILLNIFIAGIISLYFIPWYQYSYGLVGMTEDGEETFTMFYEWWSPFYELVLMDFHIFTLIFFILSISFPIAALTYGILSFLNKKYEKMLYLFLGLSILVFLITCIVMIIFSPAR